MGAPCGRIRVREYRCRYIRIKGAPSYTPELKSADSNSESIFLPILVIIE